MERLRGKMFPASIYWVRHWQSGSEIQVVKENGQLMYRRLWCVSHCQGFTGLSSLHPLLLHQASLWLCHPTATSPLLTMWANQSHLLPLGSFGSFSLFSFYIFSSLFWSLMLIEEVIAMSSLAVVSFSPQVLSYFLQWWWLLLIRSCWQIFSASQSSACVCLWFCGDVHARCITVINYNILTISIRCIDSWLVTKGGLKYWMKKE